MEFSPLSSLLFRFFSTSFRVPTQILGMMMMQMMSLREIPRLLYLLSSSGG